MSARGRKIGELQNERDERGWMIPREGTRRRAVYDELILGKDARSICESLSMGMAAFETHKACIARWQKVLRWRRSAALEMRAS